MTAVLKDKYIVKYGVEHNDKDPEFKVGCHVRTYTFKNVFAKDYNPSW